MLWIVGYPFYQGCPALQLLPEYRQCPGVFSLCFVSKCGYTRTPWLIRAGASQWARGEYKRNEQREY